MSESAFHPEDKARSLVDRRLAAGGWLVQSKADMNLGAALGVSVREFQTASGPVDYGLFVGRRLCGVNQRFTLKERPMVRADLDDFIACYRSGRRGERKESEKFKRFPLSTLLARDKLNLDIFWLKDDALDDPNLLPPPDQVATEIVDSLEIALERFRGVAAALRGSDAKA